MSIVGAASTRWIASIALVHGLRCQRSSMQTLRTPSEAHVQDAILDVVVIGGGLSGVSVARELCQRGLDLALFEARPRLGGRVESVACEQGTALDLGPTWYWPAAQPRMLALTERLGLRSLPQHDPGDVLVLEHAGDAPKQLQSESLHAGARRLLGGMQGLLDALARDLPRERVHLEHALCSVTDRAAHLELSFACRGERRVVRARRVVLAIPPRLIAEQVRFEPELDEDLEASLHATPTWMGTAAKVVLRYAGAFWRAAGHSGNAFVQHEQAVLGELFDSSDEASGLFALGAFLALGPQQRERYSVGLPLLMQHQIPQLFEAAQAKPLLHYRDWAREPWTCSRRDLREHVPHAAHPDYGAPELSRPYWSERLYFAGSETAEHEGGYLEGALVAAERVLLQLTAADACASEATQVSDASA
jgi:monoamine oxidase